MKHVLAAALGLALSIIAGVADASHNRGSALVPSIDSSGNLTIEATSFWRPTFVGSVSRVTVTRPDSTTFLLGMGANTTDTSDTRFTRVDQTASTNISASGAGEYTISWQSCCRVAGITNVPSSGGADMGTTSTLFWDGTNATNPITFDLQNIQPNVVRGTAYTDNLGATSANGDTLSYDDTVLTVDITNQAPGFSIDPTGQINMSAATTAAYGENTSGNVGADVAFAGEIIATDSNGQKTGSVQFDWLFDAVATGSNAVPSVSDDIINATIGDLVGSTITGTDPNGDIVTLSLQNFNGPGGAVGNGVFTATNGAPASGTLSWDTTGFAAGTYVATIFGTDGSLSDTGTITINLTAPVSAVPLPAGMLLLGPGLLGLVLVGRRRRQA